MAITFEPQFELVNLLTDHPLWTGGDRPSAKLVRFADIISPIVFVAMGDRDYAGAQLEHCRDRGGDRDGDLSALAVADDRCIFERQYRVGAIEAMDQDFAKLAAD